MKFKLFFRVFSTNRGFFGVRGGGYDDLRRKWGGIWTRRTSSATNRASLTHYAHHRVRCGDSVAGLLHLLRRDIEVKKQIAPSLGLSRICIQNLQFWERIL